MEGQRRVRGRRKACRRSYGDRISTILYPSEYPKGMFSFVSARYRSHPRMVSLLSSASKNSVSTAKGVCCVPQNEQQTTAEHSFSLARASRVFPPTSALSNIASVPMIHHPSYHTLKGQSRLPESDFTSCSSQGISSQSRNNSGSIQEWASRPDSPIIVSPCSIHNNRSHLPHHRNLPFPRALPLWPSTGTISSNMYPKHRRWVMGGANRRSCTPHLDQKR